MFQYLSTLVEIGAFKLIDISCLIVGHTHASIDQYFSSVQGKTKRSSFVATPESLKRLCDTPSPELKVGVPSKYQQPLLHIDLKVVYDYKTAFGPYLCKHISGHQLPYNYRLYMVRWLLISSSPSMLCGSFSNLPPYYSRHTSFTS